LETNLLGAKVNKKERLDSWKEIAEYLNRTERTCYRWNKELDLPVYRINKKSKRSKVFAYKPELDAWFEKRAGTKMDRNKKSKLLKRQ
jgi:hypothetical protein